MLSRQQLVISGALLLLTLQRSQAGSDQVVRQYQFVTQAITEIAFRGSVGEMHFSPSRDDQVHVELVIEPQEHGWFNRQQTVDDVQLDSRTRGNRLILTQDAEETRTI